MTHFPVLLALTLVGLFILLLSLWLKRSKDTPSVIIAFYLNLVGWILVGTGLLLMLLEAIAVPLGLR